MARVWRCDAAAAFGVLTCLLCDPPTGAVGWLRSSSVTIVPFCSTWTAWTPPSPLYPPGSGCVLTTSST